MLQGFIGICFLIIFMNLICKYFISIFCFNSACLNFESLSIIITVTKKHSLIILLPGLKKWLRFLKSYPQNNTCFNYKLITSKYKIMTMKSFWNYLFLLKIIYLINVNSTVAQITLDTSLNNLPGIGYGYKLVQISTSETKWYFCDTVNNTFSLYNMDFTPFISNIGVPEPFSFSNNLMQVLYITRSLFDCDTSNIEYAYYSAFNNGRPFRIMRTDGTLLFQRDSANGPYSYGNLLGGTDVLRPIVNTSAGAKLFLQPYPLLAPVYVYSLCGTLPTDVFDFTNLDHSYLTLFPNPSAHSLTFKLNSLDNINEYQIVLMDSYGNQVLREAIKSQRNEFNINVENLNQGTYFYSLCSKSKVYQSGKFLITK